MSGHCRACFRCGKVVVVQQVTPFFWFLFFASTTRTDYPNVFSPLYVMYKNPSLALWAS